ADPPSGLPFRQGQERGGPDVEAARRWQDQARNELARDLRAVACRADRDHVLAQAYREIEIADQRLAGFICGRYLAEGERAFEMRHPAGLQLLRVRRRQRRDIE